MMDTPKSDQWNPDQYGKFHSERARPFWDLAKCLPFENIFSMLDLGCGTGELTQALHLAHGLTQTVGVDSSEAMLERSQAHVTRGLRFVAGEIEFYTPDLLFDLVFSNAALQWVNNHSVQFPRLLKWVKPGGYLAVQMPINFDHPSHRLAEEAAASFGLKPRAIPVLPPEDYAQLLWNCGLVQIDVHMRVYLHPMPSALDVVEWTKGTLLTHYQKQLSEKRYAEFVQAYTQELRRELGEGKYLYKFKRLFIVARKD